MQFNREIMNEEIVEKMFVKSCIFNLLRGNEF